MFGVVQRMDRWRVFAKKLFVGFSPHCLLSATCGAMIAGGLGGFGGELMLFVGRKDTGVISECVKG